MILGLNSNLQGGSNILAFSFLLLYYFLFNYCLELETQGMEFMFMIIYYLPGTVLVSFIMHKQGRFYYLHVTG